jgi:uncharacterized protein (TIGR03790 family)
MRWLAGLLMLLLLAPAARALEPDEIVLIVNSNVDAGRRLAEYYAKVRNIPEGRILAIPLPGSEQISAEQYEAEVVPAVRLFLRERRLENKVRCLVTFWGVPIRIGAKKVTPEEKQEIADIDKAIKETRKKIIPTLKRLEQSVLDSGADFLPGKGESIDQLAARADAATRTLARHLPATRPSDQQAMLAILMQIMLELAGPESVADRPEFPLQPEQRAALAREAEAARTKIVQLTERRFDPESRRELREVAKSALGLFGYARLLRAQREHLDAGSETVAAFDSELSLLWWNYYSRTRWQLNPLHFKLGKSLPADVPPVLMTMRLDGPQEGTARDIIVASLKAEREGLKGRIVLDSRGIPTTKPDGKADGYGVYDETIRRLAQMLAEKTKLEVVHDQRPDVLPARTPIQDVMLYCGWYSLRNYVGSMVFKPGAVGYHVASLEMISLKDPREKGWAAGLLNDGITATMGAVGEPYLHAFPPADQFFPLLMTGELTLAETYWKTNLLTSWMICVIGDPLYRPFKVNPPLRKEDLPKELQSALDFPPAGGQKAQERP